MSSSRGRTWLNTLLLTTAVALAGACDSPPPPAAPTSTLPAAQFANYPAEANEFRFHWAAAQGIDLETGPAVPLRAYVESMRLAAFAGGDGAASYPGLARITPENTGPVTNDGGLFQLEEVRPLTRAEYEAHGVKDAERQIYGYQPTYVLDLAPQGDGYRATVCLGLYSVYRTADDDHEKYFSTIADPETGRLRYDNGQTVEIWRVELTDKDPRVGNPPAAPAIPQAGPLPAPLDDVFGPWFITGRASGRWGPAGESERIDTPEIRQQCEDAMPDDAATRMAMATGFHSQPPPDGNPIPGWPDQVK